MKRAFTLIEVLVAVGVLALMSALIFGVMSSMFAISEDTDDLVEVNHMARVTLERLTRDLSHAFLSMNQGELETTKTVFIGERDRVLFTYMGNIPVHAGGLETDQGVVEYRLSGRSKDRSGRKLIRRFKRHIDDDPEDGGEEYIVAIGVKKLLFEYWDTYGEDWKSDWKVEDCLDAQEPGFTLPQRVRITLVMYDRRDNEVEFETQTAIYVNNPLVFGAPTTQKQKDCTATQLLLRQQRETQAF